jgi:hypothetical protein
VEAPKPIQVTKLGMEGVWLDPHPLFETPDNALTNAQNASHDPRAGHGGALRKRPGLQKFNQANAGGAVLGGMPMAVAGTGGAPVTGGGATTGSSIGIGEGTGAPGQTTDPTGVSNGPGTAGSDAYDTTGTLFSGRRLIAIGMDTNTLNNGYGWYLTSKKFADASEVITTPGPPGMPTSTGWEYGLNGKPCVRTPDGYFYYAKASSESTSGNTVDIRRTNGATDVKVTTITALADPNDQANVFAMAFGDNKIYVGVRDSLYNAATQVGRIFIIDHVTFGKTTTTEGSYMSVVPAALYWDAARHKLYFACNRVYTTLNVDKGEIGVWCPSHGYLTGGEDAIALGAYEENVCHAIVGHGECLYWGCVTDSDGTHGGLLYGVSMTNDGSMTGVDSSTLTVITGGDLTTYKAETTPLADYSGVNDLIEFNGKLFISWYNHGTRSAILSGDQTTSGTPGLSNITARWTETTAAKRVPLKFFVDDGVLYAIGSTGQGGNHLFLYSEDGITWTDKTATVNVGDPATAYPLPVLFGMNQ